MRTTSLLALPAVALAAVALAACSSPAAGPVAAPSTPAASAPAAETSAPAVETSAPAAEATTPATKTAEPVATKQDYGSKSDWAKPLFKALKCKHYDEVSDAAEIQLLKRITIGGDEQTVTAASCPTTTSTNPVFVRVYTGGPDSKLLLDAGSGQSLRTAAVTVKGGDITITSEALSDSAPLCCPDLRIVQSFPWDGATYGHGEVTEKPL